MWISARGHTGPADQTGAATTMKANLRTIGAPSAALLVPVRRAGRTTGKARATSEVTAVEQETVGHG